MAYTKVRGQYSLFTKVRGHDREPALELAVSPVGG